MIFKSNQNPNVLSKIIRNAQFCMAAEDGLCLPLLACSLGHPPTDCWMTAARLCSLVHFDHCDHSVMSTADRHTMDRVIHL
jgi:hypothetical protein